MEARLEMGDEREMRSEEYMEEGRCYRCGEVVHEDSCRIELLQGERCQFQAGHNRLTCRYIKLCQECGLWGHSTSECGRRWERVGEEQGGGQRRRWEGCM